MEGRHQLHQARCTRPLPSEENAKRGRGLDRNCDGILIGLGRIDDLSDHLDSISIKTESLLDGCDRVRWPEDRVESGIGSSTRAKRAPTQVDLVITGRAA